MADTDTDIITLADIKRELRLDDVDVEFDDMITAQITSAIAFCSAFIGRPVLSASASIDVLPPPAPRGILSIYAPDIIAVDSVKFWPVGSAEELPPNTIALADRRYIHNGCAKLWPPAAGWPSRTSVSGCLRVAYRAGITSVASLAIIRQAVVLLVRPLLAGVTDMRPTAAFKVLLRPLVRMV